MHYKKGALVLIIRKILTELPHDLPEVLIFTNAHAFLTFEVSYFTNATRLSYFRGFLLSGI